MSSTFASNRLNTSKVSLTQSAILHLGRGGVIDEDVLDRCVTLTESTSPSALLTASLHAALAPHQFRLAGCALTTGRRQQYCCWDQ